MARPSPAHGDGTDQAVAAFGGEHERLRLTGMQPRAEGGRTVFIDGTGEAEATGDLATWYESQRTAWGYLPNYAEIFASRPEVAHAWSNLNLTIRGGMDRRRFELATIAASRALRCIYCLAAHSKFLRDVVDDDVAKELRVGGEAVGAAQGARRRDRRQLEPASIHTAADREVEVAPGVGDLGPAGEDLGVVGQVSPGGALRLVPGGEVTGGLGLARPVDEHGPAPSARGCVTNLAAARAGRYPSRDVGATSSPHERHRCGLRGPFGRRHAPRAGGSAVVVAGDLETRSNRQGTRQLTGFTRHGQRFARTSSRTRLM